MIEKNIAKLGERFGKEDGDAQEKHSVSHFSLGLALLKVIHSPGQL